MPKKEIGKKDFDISNIEYLKSNPNDLLDLMTAQEINITLNRIGKFRLILH